MNRLRILAALARRNAALCVTMALVTIGPAMAAAVYCWLCP